MTPQELIDAVRPCLPLPGIVAVDYDPDIKLSFLMETEGDGWQSMPLKPYALNHIIGAIAQACDERGWSVHTMMNGVRCVTIYGPLHENDSGVRKLGESDGRGVIAWCRAYAQAKEATK